MFVLHGKKKSVRGKQLMRVSERARDARVPHVCMHGEKLLVVCLPVLLFTLSGARLTRVLKSE